jgi:plastocyanin
MQVRSTSRVICVVALVVAAGCGGGGGGGPTANNTGNKTPPPPPGTPNSVVVTNNAFAPTDLTVSKGATVTWTWDTCTGGGTYGGTETCVAHDIVFDDAAAGSGSQSSGSFSRNFSVAGTFPYHCALHGAAMSGKVVVQ